jgi:hypothetical protein
MLTHRDRAVVAAIAAKLDEVASGLGEELEGGQMCRPHLWRGFSTR